MCRIYMVLICLVISIGCFSQASVTGVAKNADTNVPLIGATVQLVNVSDTGIKRATITDSVGRFTFTSVVYDSFLVRVTSIGFSTVQKSILVKSPSANAGIFALNKTADVLADVTVTATVPLATQKGDTIQFNASQFKVNPDASVEDLAKKMPGITVENGQVKANGENVQKVTLDGRELFGDDATAALRNLPAEIVDKIQVFDRLSDQAKFTGVDDGNSAKGINITTKVNMRNGQFGRVFGGYGTNDKYSAGGNATRLKENERISIVGNFNNINQQNFASQDLLGVTSTSSQRGGRGGGRGGGNTGNFLVGQQNGINKTTAAGLNYANSWGTKLTLSGSYFFNNADNATSELVDRQYYLKGIPNYNQNTEANSSNTNHRVNLRVEYKFDSANQLIISPGLNFQENTSDRNVNTSFIDNSTASLKSRTNNANSSDRTGNNLNNNILYRHSFTKKGRTFSLNLNTSSNNRTGNVYTSLYDTTFNGIDYTDSLSRRFTDQTTGGYQLSANAVYTEPAGKNAQLQFNYNPSFNKSKADQQAYQYENTSNKYSVFDPLLSNKFENIYKAQNAGFNYRYGTRDNQLSFGLNYQYSELHSDRVFPQPIMVEKSFKNLLPNAMARFKLSTKSNIRVFYRANTNQPSVTQLQDVYDLTNIPFVSAGNPQLEQQYNHSLSTRYTYTNTGKGIILVGNVFLQTAHNYITNATFVPLRDSTLANGVVLKSAQQLTKPVNLNGYVSLRSFVNMAIPVKLIKSNINFNGGVTYTKLPGFINNRENLSRNTTYSAGGVVASNVSQYIDFTVSYSANFSTVKNELQPNLNNRYFSQVSGLQLNLLSKKGWFFQSDVANQMYSGLANGYNQSYFLWNMGAGKKLLKSQKAEIKVSVFDLLKQNRSINRNVTETYIEDVQNQVLQQYFMLTFTYNLRSFGTPARSNRGDGMRAPRNF